jgi:hypothetical protein
MESIDQSSPSFSNFIYSDIVGQCYQGRRALERTQ